jgi:uncharacterized protein (DUF983 family)
MNDYYSSINLGLTPFEITMFIIIIVLELTLKAIAMWMAARKNQPVWFVCIMIFNTAGILPLIYILINRKKKNK